MRTYLDSSAVVKLVQGEDESSALEAHLQRLAGEEMVTSALSRVEVVRAVSDGGLDIVAMARRQLARLYQVPLAPDLLDRAAALLPGGRLRSLDAIHLASAQLIGDDLRAVVTYDRRMAEAAGLLGMPVESPA